LIREIYVAKDSSVYPNPTSEIVNISIGGQALKANILLFNLDGNLLFSKEVILNPLKRSYQIPVDHFPPGLYFIRVISGERIENLKLLKR